MPPTWKDNKLTEIDGEPALARMDEMIDAMLDPYGQDEFPSLGFPNEKRGSYFLQITAGDVLISVWRIKGANGDPTTYSVAHYTKHEYDGVMSWGGKQEDKVWAQDLLQVQAIIHHIITSKGNLS